MQIRAVWLILAAAALVASGCSSSGKPLLTPTVQGEVIAPDHRNPLGPLAGTGLDGSTVDSAGNRGSVMLINWFASWCPPCRAETPGLVALEKQLRPDGVKFLGIDTKDDSGPEFVKSESIDYPVIVDHEGSIVLKLAVSLSRDDLPFTMLIDKQGRIAAFYLGPVLPKDGQKAIATLQSE